MRKQGRQIQPGVFFNKPCIRREAPAVIRIRIPAIVIRIPRTRAGIRRIIPIRARQELLRSVRLVLLIFLYPCASSLDPRSCFFTRCVLRLAIFRLRREAPAVSRSRIPAIVNRIPRTRAGIRRTKPTRARQELHIAIRRLLIKRSFCPR